MLNIWLFYGIPSVVLILYFHRLLKRSEFMYSFYRIIQSDMIVNLFCYLNAWAFRMVNIPATKGIMIWLNNNFYFFFHVISFFSLAFYHMQAISVMIMSGHRLWSSLSTTGQNFWNKYYIAVYICVVLISSGLTLPVKLGNLFAPFVYDAKLDAFKGAPVEPEKAALYGLIFFIESIVYFIVILLINILTIISVFKRFKNKTGSSKTRTMMRNLTTIAFIHTIIFFWVVALQLFGRQILSGMDSVDRNNLLMFTSDMLSLSLPYILLAFDQNVRNTLFKMTSTYFIKKTNSQRTASGVLSVY